MDNVWFFFLFFFFIYIFWLLKCPCVKHLFLNTHLFGGFICCNIYFSLNKNTHTHTRHLMWLHQWEPLKRRPLGQKHNLWVSAHTRHAFCFSSNLLAVFWVFFIYFFYYFPRMAHLKSSITVVLGYKYIPLYCTKFTLFIRVKFSLSCYASLNQPC